MPLDEPGGLPGGSVESPANAGDFPCVRKMSWRRKWQPTPIFLSGEFHGQRSVVGYCPRGHKELDTTEQLNTYAYTQALKIKVSGSEFL